MTEKLYFHEPLTFVFTATVQDVRPQEDGSAHVLLNRTYFYPTGGGQAHDMGTLNNIPVTDVIKQDDDVLHVIDGTLEAGTEISAHIDQTRRMRYMAAHTGQHLLSAAFLRELNAQTLAVKMNADTPSTIDFDRGDLSWEQVRHIEHVANRVIREDRAITSQFVPPDSPKLNELRRAVKADKVQGDVRLVEIEDWDLSACAGTHLSTTGMLGLLKILKSENYKGGSRVYFVTGDLALQIFQQEHTILDDLSNQLSSSITDVISIVTKMQDERAQLSKEVAALREALLRYEMDELLQSATILAGKRLIVTAFDGRDGDNLRTLANLLAEEADVAIVFANAQGTDTMLITAAGAESGVHAGNTLRALAEQFGGRGGGRDNYAQGVIKDHQDADAIITWASAYLAE